MTDKDGLPEPPIELSGFRTCSMGDRREVREGEEFCGQHGGKPMTAEILRRSILRSCRMAVHQMRLCADCAGVPLDELRCRRCTWMRGAAMGMAGIAEGMGWESDVEPLMKMIGHFDPGWQKRAFA